MYRNTIKRLFGLIISFPTLIVFSPLMLLIFMMIKVDSKGPAIYTQERDGKNNILFKIYKFRTMKTDAPEVAPALLTDPDLYITRVGKFLRKTSLDELPQLLNIVKGDMAIVGPRPCLWNEKELIELRKKNGVNKLMPGLTGWAQINGRDEVEMEEKVMMDKYYGDNMSFLFDLKIILMTVFRVLKSEGIKEGS